MLSQDILQAIKQYTANMQSPLTFVLQSGEHEKREELKTFLSDIASCNELLSLEERETALRSPISFFIEVDGKDTGVQFSGIPSGHEFNSLILAVLQSTGTPLKLDESLQKMVGRVSEKLHFEVFIGLSCHNCPDVVQALNQFALLNDNISSEMIDGALFQDIIKERDIQGVPSVYVNGELFANGKVDAAQLIEKLMERDSSIAQADEADALPLQDVTVIGGGPAGVASAIYSARKGLKVTLIAERLGGQVKDTMGIENLISVSKTTGPELTGNLVAHMNDYDITVKEHLRVSEVIDEDIKTVVLSSGERIATKTLIIATGAKWRELNVPGEKENIGNGVAYCPHCDGPFFKGKDVAVIGGGNSGIEAALDLAGIVKHVTVFEFADTLRADQVLIAQAEKRDNITIIKSAATQEITAANGKVNGLTYMDRATEEVKNIALDGVFVQIGLVPNSAFVKDIVETTPYGEIKIDEKCHTSSKGIYAAGDVSTVPYKQIVIAMGEGSKASLSSFEYLLANSERLEALYEAKELEEVA
jgi:alkyl hydroperoxide reductase subunit F